MPQIGEDTPALLRTRSVDERTDERIRGADGCEIMQHGFRQNPAAPEPESVHRQLSVALTLYVERMVMQGNLAFIEQCCPGATGRKLSGEITTKQIDDGQTIRQNSILRTSDVEAAAAARKKFKAMVGKRRLKRRNHGNDMVRTKREITAGHHPRTAHLRLQIDRIGTQPGECACIARFMLPADRCHGPTGTGPAAEMALKLPAFTGLARF